MWSHSVVHVLKICGTFLFITSNRLALRFHKSGWLFIPRNGGRGNGDKVVDETLRSTCSFSLLRTKTKTWTFSVIYNRWTQRERKRNYCSSESSGVTTFALKKVQFKLSFYAGITPDTPDVVLCSKLGCWHNPSEPTRDVTLHHEDKEFACLLLSCLF